MVSRGLMYSLAKRYYKFPLYAVPSDFLNSAAQQVPVLLLSNYFGMTVVGFYALTQRVLSLPLSFLAASMTDVFRQRASSDFAKTGDCRRIFVKTFKSLLAFAAGPSVLFFLLAPWLFSVAFGSKWRVAGEYAQLMAPLFFLRFVVSPLTYVFYIAEKQYYDLAGQVILLVCSLASIRVGALYNSPKLSISLFSGCYSAVYLAYLVASFAFSRQADSVAVPKATGVAK
jgi:O-antigen/teichoic acid export membrane protein